MGASNSKIEEDKALQLCRERRKFVKKALDGRCSLAAAHVAYIQSMRSTGVALRKFVEPEFPVESSLYTSTTATPEPLALTEKAISHFSFSSPPTSHQVGSTETFSPTPSLTPPSTRRIHTNHMRFGGSFSRKVEEKPPVPVTGTVTSSSTPQTTTPRSNPRPDESPFDDSALPSGTPPWDFFGIFHPIDDQLSFQDGKGNSQGYENSDDIRRMREEEGIPELEDDHIEKASFRGKEESQDSEDEFDEPATDSLVRSFENFNRVNDQGEDKASSMAVPPMPPPAETSASQPSTLKRYKSTPVISSTRSESSETDGLNIGKSNSPGLSPTRATESATVPPVTSQTQVKESRVENKVSPKDFYASMKDIEYLFTKASECGKEVPRMLEANKLHFRPIIPGKQSGSTTSTFLKTCFSCGDDQSEVHEEPAQAEQKYLTWHRTASSRSSSSRNPLNASSKDDIEDFTDDVFENIAMISGSHASTLDRLFAWERKLYDEVKASEIIRGHYDAKRKILRQLESNGEGSQKIDKTRSGVKDLHSRLRVSIHRIDSISKRIEELRDQELQPQLEELIEGLSRMWEVMFECHKLQFHIITIAFHSGNTKISMQSESHRQITVRLENELGAMGSSFTKWIAAQRSYLQAINDWLNKCAPPDKNKSSKRKRRIPGPPLRDYGPPIYIVCGVWLEKFNGLHVKEVADSIKSLAAETARFLPRQEKNSDPVAYGLRDEASEDLFSGFDHFRSSLVSFFGQLNSFAESSVKMYAELDQAIRNSKASYQRHQPHSQSKPRPQTQTQPV